MALLADGDRVTDPVQARFREQAPRRAGV